MKKVVSIGWDVGGWHGRKNAISVITHENGALKLTTPPQCLTREFLFDNGNDVPTIISKQMSEDSELVVAIDSPFGFPKAFTNLIADDKYTSTDVGDKIYDNMYAFRETDKNIIEKLGKKPISPSKLIPSQPPVSMIQNYNQFQTQMRANTNQGYQYQQLPV